VGGGSVQGMLTVAFALCPHDLEPVNISTPTRGHLGILPAHSLSFLRCRRLVGECSGNGEGWIEKALACEPFEKSGEGKKFTQGPVLSSRSVCCRTQSTKNYG
jgi:hypothetical protein